jgi:hypothetical protein
MAALMAPITVTPPPVRLVWQKCPQMARERLHWAYLGRRC